MISLEKAKVLFKQKYPKREVMKIMDYDSVWYLFEAVEDRNVRDFDSPFFAVNKQTGTVRTYSPMDDIDNFMSVVADHVIYEVT